MKSRLILVALLLSLLGSAGNAWADRRWRDLPPDEREQLRQQMRDHWQREHDARREEVHPRWRDLPKEDRRRLRDEIREQRDSGDYREGRRRRD